jgi:hypothetical protein
VRRSLKLSIGLPALALAGMLMLSPAQAQQGELSDEKLNSFVVAAIAVEDLVEEWQPRIEEAATEEEALELRAQANAELVAAVEQTPGITVEEYQEIGIAAQTDPTLAERIRTLYEEQYAD